MILLCNLQQNVNDRWITSLGNRGGRTSDGDRNPEKHI